MKHNKILRVFIVLAAVMMFTAAFSVTAFAYTPPEAEQGEPPETTEPAASESTAPEATPEPAPPLTPDGNLTLVDDLSGEQTNGKQFITVITKNGNYFYLIIDRAGDKENVYFLNLVDEADLLALMEGQEPPAPVTPPAVVATPEPDAEQPIAPEPEQKNSIGGILALVLLVGALGGGAYWFFKVRKPKQAAGGTNISELDDFDFDEDEPELDRLTDGDADADPAADYEDADGAEDFDIGEPPEMEDKE
jgi:flagellar basal body-associated protein FliL